MQIVWDEAKRRTNLATHGLDFADASDRFAWRTALILPSYEGRHGHARFVATGDSTGGS